MLLPDPDLTRRLLLPDVQRQGGSRLQSRASGSRAEKLCGQPRRAAQASSWDQQAIARRRQRPALTGSRLKGSIGPQAARPPGPRLTLPTDADKKPPPAFAPDKHLLLLQWPP